MQSYDGDILVLLIMLPLYTIGFCIAGCLGGIKRDEDLDTISAWRKLPRKLSDLWKLHDSEGDLTGPTKEISTLSLNSAASATSHRSTAYFKTDSFTQEEISKSSCTAQITKNLFDMWEIFIIYTVPILSIMDNVSDISMDVFFLSQARLRQIGYLSLFIIIFQRVTSAIILADNYGWEAGTRQLFDLEVFFAVYNSIKYERIVLQVIQLKILEGFFESFPQLLLQMYYLVKRAKKGEENFMIWVSITLSLLSLSKCWLFSDEVSLPYDGFKNKTKKNENVCSKYFAWYVGIIVLWAWRFGEITVTISIIVGFANSVSARGSFGLFAFLLLNAFIIQSIYPESRKSSWFYHAIKKHRTALSLLSISVPEWETTDWPEDDENERFKCDVCFYYNFFRHWIILTVLHIAEINYFLWALPTLGPRKFVIVYYIWKLSLFSVLLIIAIFHKANNTLYVIFGTLLYYVSVGLFCFITGGTIAWLFVIDKEQYSKAIEADPNFLLKILLNQQFIFIERLMRSGVCSAYRIVEDAVAWMHENGIDPFDEEAIAKFATDQPFCKLLYYLIKDRLVEVAPVSNKNIIINAEAPKYYRHYAVPALVYRCNHIRENTLRSQLASTILSKLLTQRLMIDGMKALVSYRTVRYAGASLKFLRHHLDAPEFLFQKSGELDCTAKELYENDFDVLFCLRAGFMAEELILAGFDAGILNDERVLEKDENREWFSELEHLKRLKDAGFKRFICLNFTMRDLLSKNLFAPFELLEYQQSRSTLHERASGYPSIRRTNAGLHDVDGPSDI